MSCAASCAVAASAPQTPYYGGGYRRNYSKKSTKKYSYKKKYSTKKSYKRKAYKKRASSSNPMNTGNDLPNSFSNSNSRKRSRNDSELGGDGAYNWRPAARWAANNIAPMAFNYGGKQLGMDDELTRRASKWATGKLLGLIGSGAYNINTHAEVNQLFKTDPEMVINSVSGETGDIIISQSEFLFDILPPAYLGSEATNKFSIVGAPCTYTTSSFTCNNKPLVINPGCSRSFPWLAKLAANFQEYEFIQLVYEYKPTISDGNTNISGTVVMFTQYNPNQFTTQATDDPSKSNVTDKRSAEGIDYTNSTKIIQGALHGIECSPSKNSGTAERLIREEDDTLGAAVGNLIDYDLGLFSLALANVSPTQYTAGTPGDAVVIQDTTTAGHFFNDTTYAMASGALNSNAIALGELWVHYTIKLSKKKVSKTS